eukprot:m.67537 g.67537  ORF g.67537 m.67537 type:complete len:65 (+) comp9869_c0_seq1:1374-1568(+)
MAKQSAQVRVTAESASSGAAIGTSIRICTAANMLLSEVESDFSTPFRLTLVITRPSEVYRRTHS